MTKITDKGGTEETVTVSKMNLGETSGFTDWLLSGDSNLQLGTLIITNYIEKNAGITYSASLDLKSSNGKTKSLDFEIKLLANYTEINMFAEEESNNKTR